MGASPPTPLQQPTTIDTKPKVPGLLGEDKPGQTLTLEELQKRKQYLQLQALISLGRKSAMLTGARGLASSAPLSTPPSLLGRS